MLMSRMPKRQKMNRAFYMLLFCLNFLTIQASDAEDLNAVIKEAMVTDLLTVAQSEQFQTVISSVTQLAGLTVTDAVVSDGVIKGEVAFLNLRWVLLAFSNGSADNTFITFSPKKTRLLSELFQEVPGAKLLDIIRPNQQLLAFALQDIALPHHELPDSVRTTMGRFFDNPSYDLKIPRGLTQFGSFNLKEVGVLNNAFEFLGGEAGDVSVRVALKGDNVLNDLLRGKAPTPHLTLTAPMPAFRPAIGGKVALPADLNMMLVGELDTKHASLGYFGTGVFDIGGQIVKMNMDTQVTLRAGAPAFTVAASTLKGEPLKQAFGINWLTIEDYRITFKQEAGSLKMGFAGKTTLGNKQFSVVALGATSVSLLGVPIPEKIQLSINDGPNKVGALSLRDIAAIFVEMLNVTGQTAVLPTAFPDLAIIGAKKGQGPSVSLVLNATGHAGLDISGGLSLLGTEVGMIERAFVQADTGVIIKAHTAKLGVGPIQFPTAEVDVSLTSDGVNLIEPHAMIKAKALSLFGSDNGFTLVMRPRQFELNASSDFGSLFKFHFLASTQAQIKSLKHLETADFQLAAELSSDPSEWIRTTGKRAVEEVFAGVQKVLGKTQRALADAQADVAMLDTSIGEMKAKINRSKDKRGDQLQAASNEVNQLNNDIAALQTQINSRHLKNCDQSERHCVLSLPVKTGCLQDTTVGCVVPAMDLRCEQYADIPNAPAIADCVVSNAGLALELVGLETLKGTLMASRAAAQTTLTVLKEGIKALPVELDPRISGLIIMREAAMFSLKTAEEAVKGVDAFMRLLPQGVGMIASPDIFALEHSRIQGSLRNAVNGKPVVLDMSFRLLGERYQQRLAFSLTDMDFNARQFEVIALGAAVHSVMKLGREAHLIPHSLLDEIQGIYNLKRADVDAALYRAIDSNPIQLANTPLMSIDEAVDAQYKAISQERLSAKQKEASHLLERLH